METFWLYVSLNAAPPQRIDFAISKKEACAVSNSSSNNVAITYARKALNPDYVLLLNNDTIVHKLFLNELVAAAEHDETIGMAGPKIYYCDFEGRHDVLSFTGGRIDMKRGLALFLNEREIEDGRVARVGGPTRF